MLTDWMCGARMVVKESALGCYVVRTDNEHGVLVMERANIAHLLLAHLGVQESTASLQLVPTEVERENICLSQEVLGLAEAQEGCLFA